MQQANEHGAAAAVLDDYRIDETYQIVLSENGLKWAQFEARIDRPIWADIVLNASPAYTSSDYRPALKNAACQLLIGPKYAVLRPEFSAQEYDARDPIAKSILLTFGAGDDRGAILYVLRALNERLSENIRFDVVSGPSNPRNAENDRKIRTLGSERFRYHIGPIRLAELFARADLAIMAGGASTQEAACLGLPMVLITIAENQTKQAIAWEKKGAAKYLGDLDRVTTGRLVSAVSRLVKDVTARQSMSMAGRSLVDGLGGMRVARAIQELAVSQTDTIQAESKNVRAGYRAVPKATPSAVPARR